MPEHSHDRRRHAPAATEATRPEGPYELDDEQPSAQPPVRDEQARFVDLIARLHDEAEQLLGLSRGQREMRTLLHLIASHFDGQLVTGSSLAAASGLSYGTALRTIEDLTARGLIVRRARTASGRSQSLHPSARLLTQWRRFAYHGEALMRGTLGKEAQRKLRRPEPSEVLPPPAVLDTKLRLGRSLRVLVHADPTFMAMLNLKRQFEMIMGSASRAGRTPSTASAPS